MKLKQYIQYLIMYVFRFQSMISMWFSLLRLDILMLLPATPKKSPGKNHPFTH